MNAARIALLSTLTLFALVSFGQEDPAAPAALYKEPFRPQLHFSPKEKWMNDPNGLVYNQGIYHLFFQYYPGDIIWGPMHWGHAVSKDLIHWQQGPIALYPDSLGYIFSGSAVVDSNNTSGFGKNGIMPLVAIFTHHDPAGEKRGDSTYQNQSLAYSLDNGKTWTKYKGNPVLKNPGIADFRDPNVIWYPEGKKWVMSLATKDRITFYSSPDLKAWTKESTFGEKTGAHGGVWECPALFPLKLEGTTYWVLLVSSNPGGPNGGSGTQYFIGQFDGKKFYPAGNAVKWIDYGPDDYAGVIWNRGARKIFLGWMSNWLYANQVPTRTWRNAMTLPRDLTLKRANGEVYLNSWPTKEFNSLAGTALVKKNVLVNGATLLSGNWDVVKGQYRLDIHIAQRKDFFLIFSNEKDQQLVVGYDNAAHQYYIDRSHSGRTDFNKEFARRYFSPAIGKLAALDLTIIMDGSSLELFADKGLTVMTTVFFPDLPFTMAQVNATDNLKIDQVTYTPLRPIWGQR